MRDLLEIIFVLPCRDRHNLLVIRMRRWGPRVNPALRHAHIRTSLNRFKDETRLRAVGGCAGYSQDSAGVVEAVWGFLACDPSLTNNLAPEPKPQTLNCVLPQPPKRSQKIQPPEDEPMTT